MKKYLLIIIIVSAVLLSIIYLNGLNCGDACAGDSENPKPEYTLNFGVGGPRINFINELKFAKELDLKNAEIGFSWNKIETQKGVFDFSEIDYVMEELSNAGISQSNMCFQIKGLRSNAHGITGYLRTAQQEQAFKDLLSEFIDRYPNVECYLIIREMNNENFPGSAADYAKLLVISNEVIPEDYTIVFAGLPYDLKESIPKLETFLEDTIAELPKDKKYFDMYRIHMHSTPKSNGIARMEEAFNQYSSQLSGVYENIDLFFETSSYTGQPYPGSGDYPRQTEQDQAEDLILRLEKMRELGVKATFIEGGIYTRPYFLFINTVPTGHLDFFEHCGIVRNCEVDDDSDDGQCTTGEPKKAFYAVKDWITQD